VGMAVGTIVYFHEDIPDIFMSKNNKAIGLRTADGVCFNHLGYFRSLGESWSKSVGFEKRENFKSKSCRRYIEQLDKNTYVANLRGQKVAFSFADAPMPKADLQLHLADHGDDYAKLMYLRTGRIEALKDIDRPWTK
jgi:hypothetical protein